MWRRRNVDAFGTGWLVITNDEADPAYRMPPRSDKTPFARQRVRCLLPAGGIAPLWLAAAFLAATWASNAQANDISRSSDGSARLAQVSTPASEEPQATADQGQQKAEVLARELAAARRDLELLQNLLNKGRDEAARARQAADREAAELRKSLQEERDRAARPGAEVDNRVNELRRSMLRDSAERMERDIASMRRGVEPQTAAAPDNGAADLRKSLQQEHDRASRLEQDLAAAKREVETQTRLAAKADEEATKLKQAKGSAELKQSLQQDRAETLAQELAAARSRISAYEAQTRQTTGQATGLKQAADGDAADLRKSLQQERARANRLEQNFAAAKREAETQAALATKAGDEAAKLKQAAEKGSAELRQSLRQEQDRAETLAQELARLYALDAQARQAREQAAELNQAAEGGVADLRESLQRERNRASRLEQDLAAAKRDVTTQTALATKAGDEAAKLKEAGESGAADLRKLLQQERDRAGRLEQDLAAAKRDVATQAARAAAAELRKPAGWRRRSMKRLPGSSRLSDDHQHALRGRLSDAASQTELARRGGGER